MSYADEKKSRCVHCEKGMDWYLTSHGVWHDEWTKCTAPTEEQYIADLEAKLAVAEADTRRMDWLEGEMDRDREALDRRERKDLAGPWLTLSLFRRNNPIHRSDIDDEMDAASKADADLVTRAEKPWCVTCDGMKRVLRFHGRGPNDPLGNGWVDCPACKGTGSSATVSERYEKEK
jgi:hypothetical protein